MENNNNKKQQQQRANKSSAEAQRKSSDLYVNNKTRNSRRREQLPTPRSEQQQRNIKQQPQQQQQSAKLRPNVDKRPRARGGGYGGGASGNANSSGYGQDFDQDCGDGLPCTGPDNAYGSTGLASSGASYMRSSDPDYELNSVYAHGSKKQNLNHLLNFHCVPRQSLSSDWHATGHGATVARRQPRYNKEQFLQANFQFVIRSSAKAQVNGSPDTLIDWNLIEQINIHTTEEPQCPICLYPPVAAKLTRCGHAYCWPCLLHYLSLSDKTWRKCPICYDAIHAADLKSCTILQQHAMNVGDTINFQLMRRLKGSIYIERYAGAIAVGAAVEHMRFPLLSAVDETKRFSKFLIAKRSDIAAIIERERRELLAESDVSCPEDVFTQQALLTLNERCEKLGLEPEEQQLQQQQQVEEEQLQAKTPDIDDKPDDASVSSLGEASSTGSSSNSSNINNNKYYYFYQSNDGQNIYLHPLNVKMLQACYGSLEQAPVLIQAQIIQKEHHSMDDEHRRKFTCLGHLPLTCQFAVVEVELQPPIIYPSILKLFKDDLLNRKKERQRREREERKREQHINEINDRQMGKLIASAANLNLSSTHEFPTCGFEEDLPAPRGTLPIAIGQTSSSGPRYSNVAASPKQELWPSIGNASAGMRHSPGEFHVGAWGRAAPPPSVNVGAGAPSVRPTVDEDNELRAVGPWALGELLVGALDQKKQQRGAKANTAPVEGTAAGKKQKKAKGKKMVPLFAVGMNRAP